MPIRSLFVNSPANPVARQSPRDETDAETHRDDSMPRRQACRRAQTKIRGSFCPTRSTEPSRRSSRSLRQPTKSKSLARIRAVRVSGWPARNIPARSSAETSESNSRVPINCATKLRKPARLPSNRGGATARTATRPNAVRARARKLLATPKAAANCASKSPPYRREDRERTRRTRRRLRDATDQSCPRTDCLAIEHRRPAHSPA